MTKRIKFRRNYCFSRGKLVTLLSFVHGSVVRPLAPGAAPPRSRNLPFATHDGTGQHSIVTRILLFVSFELVVATIQHRLCGRLHACLVHPPINVLFPSPVPGCS